jgi:hypothetical protein
MKQFANVRKSSTGWFYGMKPHLVINGDGKIISFCITSGNVSDINENVIERPTKNIFGKLVGDKGYISKKIFEKHITMITKVRRNMKNRFIPLEDKLLLRKRAVIESVNNILKETFQIEHTMHRIPINFLVDLVSGIVENSFFYFNPMV